jgi:hypothetical protein
VNLHILKNCSYAILPLIIENWWVKEGVIMLTLYQTKTKDTKIQQNKQKTIKGFASFFPVLDNPNTKVKAGYYFFVQFKTSSKGIYLLPMISYTSAHSFLTVQVLKLKKDILKETDLLSAGELIIGADGQIVAWCLKSGTYREKLSLTNPELIKKTNLPIESYYTVSDWEKLPIQNYITLYFDKYGASKCGKDPIISVKNFLELRDAKLSEIVLADDDRCFGLTN